jgi:outer membrane murein-binding lipoprotein Lpp
MSAPQNFRSALNGFNREDVVRYLEYINNKHTTQVNQLNSEIDYLRTRVESIQPDIGLIEERDALRSQVQELEARCAQLQQQLSAAPQAAPVSAEPVSNEAAPVVTASDELEAYRRAERTERLAKERAELIYHQVNGVLADATVKVDGIATEIGTMADQVMAQLTQLQTAVSGSKKTLQEAVSTMYAIKPNN